MMGASALAMGAMFTACSNDDGPSAEQYYEALYSQAFEKAFGKISPNQDWGFGVEGSTRANPGTDIYPATHEYTDAAGNVIAGANMNHNEWADPDKEFGGWIVPDPLTDGQKLRVQKYFQANPNLAYEDPHFRHFFVQQVYTGGTSAPETGNKEATVAANGQAHAGMTLNQLTVGVASSHINDFNAGTCTASQVLDNGSNVNSGTYHSDQITLMVNVYDTSCFGYHETSGSNTGETNNHNDKMALVSAAVIDAWAAANGNPGEAVVDKWNRSFMGFDYELLPESEIVMDSYARLDAVPNLNNIPYAWDGNQVMTIGEKPEAPQATPREEVDITATFAQNPANNNTECAYDENGNIVCTFNNQWYNNITFVQAGDWSQYDKLVIEFAEPSPVALTLGCDGEAAIAVGATTVEVPVVGYAYNGGGGPSIYGGTGSESPVTLKIKKVTLVKEATTPVVDNSIVYYNPTYLLGDNDADKVAFYSTNTNMYGGIVRTVTEDEMKTTQDGKTCLDLTFFKGLVADGYHPITSDLRTWVKWQAACDGYYSDWIVTLTEAQRIDEEIIPDGPTVKNIRIMAEDLSASEASDFDFNDVVFDVEAEYPEGVDAVSQVKITLWAAGGTLPLRLNGDDNLEVHALLGTADNCMTNTHAFDRVDKEGRWLAADGMGNWSSTITLANGATIRKDYFNSDVNTNLRVEVFKTGKWFVLTANEGVAACKIGCKINTPWAVERSNMDKAFESFKTWVNTASPKDWESSKVESELYNNSGKTVWYRDRQ